MDYRAIAQSDAEEDQTISTSVVTLTLPSVANSRPQGFRAVVQCRTNDVLYTINGDNPTAADKSTGTTLNVDDLLILYDSEISNVKFIRATGSDGAIHVRYERRST